MSLSTVISELRSANQPVPEPARLPTKAQVLEAETLLGISLHEDFRRFLLEASDVVVGTLEPVTVCDPESHTHLVAVLESARAYGVPENLVPVCQGNADFCCMDANGKIHYWSHNGKVDEAWSCLEDWIRDVWLGET